MLRVDLHTHCWYSHDSILKPKHFISACLKTGINCVAVTDHNEIEGALRIKRDAPFKVIIGEEIRTRDGEITGLFLKKRILPNLSAQETIKEIRQQGGLVYIPHPFATGVFMRLKKSVLDAVIKDVDIIEGWNSRGLGRHPDRLAQEYAKRHKKPFGAGSDAHTRWEIGSAYVEMKAFKSKKEFLKNLGTGILTGKKTNLVFPAGSTLIGRAKVLTGHRGERARQRRTNQLNTE